MQTSWSRSGAKKWVLVAAAAVVAACGGDEAADTTAATTGASTSGAGGGTTATTSGAGGATSSTSTTSTSSAGGSGGGVACSVSTMDFGDLGAFDVQAFLAPGPDLSPADDVIQLIGSLESGDPADYFTLELYAGFGVYAGGDITPGEVAIAGSETQFADCGACTRVITNLTPPANYEHEYLATSGTVNVTAVGTAVGETVEVTFSSLTFEHVDILNEAPFTSTPVGDGCTTFIMSGSISAPLEPPPGG